MQTILLLSTLRSFHGGGERRQAFPYRDRAEKVREGTPQFGEYRRSQGKEKINSGLPDKERCRRFTAGLKITRLFWKEKDALSLTHTKVCTYLIERRRKMEKGKTCESGP